MWCLARRTDRAIHYHSQTRDSWIVGAVKLSCAALLRRALRIAAHHVLVMPAAVSRGRREMKMDTMDTRWISRLE
ncbi:hypothetical protein CMUS01_04172 [Colletotrichum musicola]|uniref:Uncharacterized protein n=1 Tax=Colletotrichum musicola TaxID=2175873 RepID=A0A8H6KY21_9PEZI|nr:hypothetical protein CMUS01_04172 [Colletotrichum musicola]